MTGGQRAVAAGASPGVLIGRSSERARLDGVVRALGTGAPSVTLLVGESGIGKSALADQTRCLATTAGFASATGRGAPLTLSQPLQPVIGALDALGNPATVTRRTLLEATVGDPIALLLQATIERLDAIVEAAPLLLVLEDLHWADPATLTLLHHLITRADRRPLAVIATSRPPQPGTPLHHLVLGAPDAVVRLEGLSDEEVDELLRDRFGLDPSAKAHPDLAMARGNPLLVEAIVARWRQGDSEPNRGELSGPVRSLVDTLPGAVLQVLQFAAVASSEIRLDVLVGLTGRPIAELLDVLAVARTAGVIVKEGDQLAFRHDLYRDAVLETLPGSARLAVHLDVARELERLGAPSLEIAEHVARGARPGNRSAVATLTATAEELAPTDPSTALRISDLAIGLLSRPEIPIPLQLVRIGALAACGQTAEAQLLGRALLRTDLPLDVEARVRRDLALAAFVEGRPMESEAHLNRVVTAAPTPELAARARTELAWTQFLALDRAAATEGALRGAELGDQYTRIAANSLLCWLGLWSIDIDLACGAAAEVEAAVVGDLIGEWQVFQPLLAAAAVHLDTGRHQRAVATAERGRQMAIAGGYAWAAPAYDAVVALAAARQGDLDVASERASAALDATALVDGFGVEIWSRAMLAELALRRGDDETARHHLEIARLATDDGRAQLGTNHLVLAQAALAGRAGRDHEVYGLLCDGWDYLSAVGALHIRSGIGAQIVQLGSRRPDAAERVIAVLGLLEADASRGGLPILRADAARALAWHERSPETVAAAVDAAAESADVLLEFDMLRSACDLAPNHRDFRIWQTRSQALAERLDLVTSAPRRQTPAKPDRPRFGRGALTEAELRVANLVAEGLTNSRIAAELVVSRRTVDTQVLSAYRKLGVTSRVALTRALLDHP